MKLCINPVLLRCSSASETENAVIIQYQAELSKIENSLVCYVLPEVVVRVLACSFVNKSFKQSVIYKPFI